MLEPNLLNLKNPLLVGSGPGSTSIERIGRYLRELEEGGWAGAVLKSAQPVSEQRIYPYMWKAQVGRTMVWQNYGPPHDVFDSNYVKTLKQVVKETDLAIIPSISTGDVEEWGVIAEEVSTVDVPAIELNFGFPVGGRVIGQWPGLAREISTVVRDSTDIPLIAKLTPNVTDVKQIASTIEDAGIDMISAINTVAGFAGVDIDTFIPISSSIKGQAIFSGLSGPIIKYIGLKCVAEIAQTVKIPVIGIGGISNYKDVIEYISLGASAVQICTEYMLRGFNLANRILGDLTSYLKKKKTSIAEIRGKALLSITDIEDVEIRKVKSEITEKCTKCGLCLTACKAGIVEAIKFEKGNYIVDVDECVGCGFCKAVCPVPGAVLLLPA